MDGQGDRGMSRTKKGAACAAALTAAVIFVASTIFLGIPAHAQPDAPRVGLTVSPPLSEFDVMPGSEYSQKIKVFNDSDTTRTITVKPQNFEASGEEGGAQTTEELGPYALSQWMQVSPQKIDMPAKKEQVFEVKIKVPNDAPPGGHFGAVVFSPSPVGQPGAKVATIDEITSLILMRVPGAATEKLSVASVAVCKPPLIKPDPLIPEPSAGKSQPSNMCLKASKVITSGGDLAISTRVRNEGNVQVQPQGTITIYNLFGSKVATLKVDPRSVIPASVRRLDSPWKNSMPFGYYSVKVNLLYGSQGQTLKAESSFWGIPKRETIIAAIILLIVIPLLWLPRKRYKKAFRALTASE